MSVYRDWGVVPKDSRDDNFNRSSDDLSKYQVVHRGDVVLNKMKTWQGSVAVSGFEGIVSPAYFVCQLVSSVYPRFIHYLLRSSVYIDAYASVSKGIRPNQWDLPYDELRQIPVIVPTIEEQRRIADFLDDQVARIDAIIRLRAEQVTTLDGRIETAADQALINRGWHQPATLEVDAVRPLPTGWRVAALSQVLRQLTNGYVGPTRDILVDDGIRYVQSLHIKGGHIDFDRRHFYVTPEWHDARPRIHLREDDVLVVQTGDIGRVAVVPPHFGEASCHALQIARVRPEIVSGRYLGAFLGSSFGYHSLLSRATGALHPHLEGGIRSVPVVIPPSDVQADVVIDVQQIRDSASAAQQEMRVQIDLLQERKRSLITAAVTGEFDVTAASGRGVA